MPARHDPDTGLALRGTTNRNSRGSSLARRARRAWLLRTFNSELGDDKVLCFDCGAVLDDSTITVDRIIPACRGGTYKRDNIRPSCGPCASKQGGELGNEQRRLKGRAAKVDMT